MMLEELFRKTLEDFSDLPDVAEAIRMSVRLIIAAILGGILGINRGLAGMALTSS
ncbi:MAG: hypothetical protein ABL888_13235 [Pirellulaceae bacterium]